MQRFLFLLLFTTQLLSAQSVRQTYNNIQDRYEYYNEKNELVGYKEKDILSGDWIYTAVSKNNNSRRSPYSHLEPVDIYDEKLALQAMRSSLERRSSALYIENYNNIKDQIEDVKKGYEMINQYRDHPVVKSKQESIDLFMKSFSLELGRINDANPEYNRKQVAQNLYDWAFDKRQWIVQSYNRIVDEINEYELNKKRMLSKLDAIQNELEVVGTDKKLQNSWKDFKDYIDMFRESVVENRVDLTDPNVASKFLDDLDKYHREVLNVKNSATENYVLIDEKSNPIETKKLYGGYRTSKILEYKKDKATGQWHLSLEENIPSKVHFSEGWLAFQRGTNKWLFARLSYSGYDNENQVYTFYDNYAQNLTVDKDFRTITWYSDRDDDGWTKIYKYTTLTKDASVIPVPNE